MKTETALGFSIAAVAGLAAIPAGADPAGMQVLKKYEHASNNFKDQYAKYRMVIREKGGPKTIKFTMYNQPGWKRLLKFTYPADIRGQMVLIMSQAEMYVYLPAYKRVRRVAGHVKNQGFLGSDFTFDDMAISIWSTHYTARLERQDAKNWYLTLKARPGKNPPFVRLKMTVEKRMRQAVRIEYLSRSGRKLRTQTFTGWTCNRGNDQCSPKQIKMVDHRRGNHTTDMYEVHMEHDKGISPRKFTLRHLARGS